MSTLVFLLVMLEGTPLTRGAPGEVTVGVGASHNQMYFAWSPDGISNDAKTFIPWALVSNDIYWLLGDSRDRMEREMHRGWVWE